MRGQVEVVVHLALRGHICVIARRETRKGSGGGLAHPLPTASLMFHRRMSDSAASRVAADPALVHLDIDPPRLRMLRLRNAQA